MRNFRVRPPTNPSHFEHAPAWRGSGGSVGIEATLWPDPTR